MEISLTRPAPSLSKENMVLIGMAFFLFCFHVLTNAFTSYGYFRDEFYYLACSKRLDWGYVDQPPLSVFLLAITRWLIGDSLFAIRLIPALALSLTVVFTGLMVREMKGGALATFIACLAVVMTPIFLAMGAFYSMNSFDILLWSVAAYLVTRIIHDQKPAYWLILGLVMGLALLNKISFLWFGAGLFMGLLFTPLRKQLLTPWPYLAGVIAFVIFSPYIIWNLQHDLAHLEFMRNAVNYKYNSLTRMDFIAGQLLLPNPAALPLWLMGLYYFFFHPAGKTHRILGIIFMTTFAILLINGHSKPEYLAPAFTLVFAGGAVLVERISATRKWVSYAIIAALVISMVLLPLAKPLLLVPAYVAYADALGINTPNTEGKEMSELPQFYADMFGWESMAAHVSEVYMALPEEERSQAVVFTQNYGEAGALEHYSAQYPLPRIISGHNNYWLWGYGDHGLQTVIIIGGGTAEDHMETFGEVEQVAVHQADYAMPYESNLPIFVCRKLKHPVQEVWEETKSYI